MSFIACMLCGVLCSGLSMIAWPRIFAMLAITIEFTEPVSFVFSFISVLLVGWGFKVKRGFGIFVLWDILLPALAGFSIYCTKALAPLLEAPLWQVGIAVGVGVLLVAICTGIVCSMADNCTSGGLILFTAFFFIALIAGLCVMCKLWLGTAIFAAFLGGAICCIAPGIVAFVNHED